MLKLLYFIKLKITLTISYSCNRLKKRKKEIMQNAKSMFFEYQSASQNISDSV